MEVGASGDDRTYWRMRALVGLGLSTSGVIGVLTGLGASWATAALITYFVAVGTATYTDLTSRRVPNALLKTAIPPVVVLFTLATLSDEDGYYLGALVGAATLFLMFGLMHLRAPTSFGAGDVKAGLLVGLAVCWFGIGQLRWLLLWAWILLALVGLPILVRRGRAHAPSLPFIPILSVSSTVTILFAIH